MEYINSGGGTSYSLSLKSHISISRNMYKKQFSLHLNSVTTEDIDVYSCARYTMKRPQCEPRQKPPSKWSSGPAGSAHFQIQT
jgi:hypothetical protein